MSSIVPDREKLDPLRVPLEGERASGFRYVYHSGVDDFGRDVWVGRVKHFGRLTSVPGSRSVHPHVSAMAVADWFAERMGPMWRDYVRRSDLPPFEVRYSKGEGGWIACVWVIGQCEDVVHLTRRGKLTTRVRVFGTQREAVAGARAFLRETCGIFRTLIAFRKLAPGEYGTRPAKGR